MSDASLPSRLLTGALAGITATTAMTAAMSRLYAVLPKEERYPLPPREITQRIDVANLSETALRDGSLAAHFAFGAAAGAVLAGGNPRQNIKSGALMGIAVWTMSYFGWVPGLRILRSANAHPWRRSALMIGVHLVWGAVHALAVNELTAARKTMLAGGPIKDAPARSGGNGNGKLVRNRA